MVPESIAADLASQLVARCRELAAITDVPGETTRTFLSEGMRRANNQVAEWMRDAGMQVESDGVGNLRGTLPGTPEAQGTFLIASHLDTVPNAGAFDGPLGVLAGVTLAQQIGAGRLPFHVEVIGFADEEGTRFEVPFLGSRALVGALDDALLNVTDAFGTSVREAIASYRLRFGATEKVTSNTLGYLEFHIEQGPQLDTEGLPLGVVETVAGQSRLHLSFRGKANHAGTTPMRLRHDALCAAAAWIVAVEEYARASRGLVATVGSIQVAPNATNVIPGEAQVSLDVRSANDNTRNDAVQHLLGVAESLAATRGVAVSVEHRMAQSAVPMDSALLRLLEDSVDSYGALVRRMTSGAGHDAMIVAPHMPAAMLFLRSPGGVSHHPDEFVRTDDVALALRVGYTFLHRLADEHRARMEA